MSTKSSKSLISGKSNAPEQASTSWYNAGVYTFKSTIFSYVARLEKSPRGEYELTDAIRAMAHDGKKVKAVEIKGYWADVRRSRNIIGA